MSNTTWYNFGKLLSGIGMALTPLAAVAPDPYSKYLLAAISGITNAALFYAFGKLEPKT